MYDQTINQKPHHIGAPVGFGPGYHISCFISIFVRMLILFILFFHFIQINIQFISVVWMTQIKILTLVSSIRILIKYVIHY